MKARTLRDGKWGEADVAELVPGDIIPADGKLVDGAYLSIDQSALTG